MLRHNNTENRVKTQFEKQVATLNAQRAALIMETLEEKRRLEEGVAACALILGMMRYNPQDDTVRRLAQRKRRMKKD